jgi:hypothetical protein
MACPSTPGLPPAAIAAPSREEKHPPPSEGSTSPRTTEHLISISGSSCLTLRLKAYSTDSSRCVLACLIVFQIISCIHAAFAEHRVQGSLKWDGLRL